MRVLSEVSSLCSDSSVTEASSKMAAIVILKLATNHRRPRNRWFLTLNKSILCTLFLLQLLKIRGNVFSRVIDGISITTDGQCRATFVYISVICLIYSQDWQLNVNKLSAVTANTFKTYKYRRNSHIFAAISGNKRRQEKSKIRRIGRLCDPTIGFAKKIFAAEKTFKTLAFFSYFENDLERENWYECSKIIHVQHAVVFVLLLLLVSTIFACF